MPLGEYPFSERYGWVQDRYGLSWQLIYTNPEGEERPLIIPSLLFVGDIYGKAEEASDFYLSVFKNTKRGTIARYPSGMEPEQESIVMYKYFKLEVQWFSAMDSAVSTALILMKQFRLWCSVKTKKRMITIGINFRPFPRPSNAAGLRTSMVSRGRSYRLSWIK